jgi:hypothetical protein
MFDIWKNLRDLMKVDYRHVSTTNPVFLIHSKLTVIILVGLSILVTSRQYLGDPIDCISSPDVKNIADKYCWIHSTFTRGRLDEDGKWGYEAGKFFRRSNDLILRSKVQTKLYKHFFIHFIIYIYFFYIQWMTKERLTLLPESDPKLKEMTPECSYN